MLNVIAASLNLSKYQFQFVQLHFFFEKPKKKNRLRAKSHCQGAKIYLISGKGLRPDVTTLQGSLFVSDIWLK